MNQKQAESILDNLYKYFGDVKPGLDYDNLYQLTISVVLSAQTTDRQVNEVTPILFNKYPDFKSLSNANISDVEKIIHSTGFFRSKAKNIKSLAVIITKKYNQNVPGDILKLTELPGVGRKSANVILSQGFDIQAIAVDTHVKRISKRLCLSNSDKPEIVERDLMKILPQSRWSQAHLLFIHHGRNICFARSPLCTDCPILNDCCFEDKNF